VDLGSNCHPAWNELSGDWFRHALMEKTGIMVDLVRREVVETAQTFVVKVGTNVLSDDSGRLDLGRVRQIAEQVHRVRESGRKVVIVSSGAIGAGMNLLNLPQRPRDLSHLQAAAAVGQAYLIRLYDDSLRRHGYHAAQLLLTAADFNDRARYLNVRNTINTLFSYRAVPIVNENDTVSTDEIRFGDNDRLAALVTTLLTDPLLVILTSVDGLYDGPPGDKRSRLIPLVRQWDDSLMDLAADETSSRGTGGMKSKLEAARMATAVGENVIIANGRRPNVLDEILAGEEVGTLFLAGSKAVPAWKRWIGFGAPPRGRVRVDSGARQALVENGRSLLAIGITDVEGDFAKGDVVSVLGPDGREFARGLTNYCARDIRAIQGRRSSEIADVLGEVPYAEVIHRDNLVLLT